MRTCECCGNAYDKPIEITYLGHPHVFDSFACAIHTLAPRCAHCAAPIIGHGVETDAAMFCCAHCARQAGVTELQDRA